MKSHHGTSEIPPNRRNHARNAAIYPPREVPPGDPNESTGVSKGTGDPVVADVFEYYRARIQPKARLCPREKIAARLKRFTVTELKDGIDRFARDPWWMEHNADRGAPWFFHSDARSEQFLLLEPRPREPQNGHAPVRRRPGDSRNPADYFGQAARR